MTRSNGDTPIHQLAAHGAEPHRSVTTAVIQVGAAIALLYHFFSPVGLRLPTTPKRPTVIPQFLVMKQGHDERALPRTKAELLPQEIRALHLSPSILTCQQGARQPAGILRGERVLRGGIPESGAGEGIWSALWRSYLEPREAATKHMDRPWSRGTGEE